MAQDLLYNSVDADMDGQPDKVTYVTPQVHHYPFAYAHPFAYGFPAGVAAPALAAPAVAAPAVPAQLAQDYAYHSVDANMDGYPDSKQIFPYHLPFAYGAHQFGAFPYAPFAVVKAAEMKD